MHNTAIKETSLGTILKKFWNTNISRCIHKYCCKNLCICQNG